MPGFDRSWIDQAGTTVLKGQPDARVLVTGGSGFIGTNMVEYYIRSGCSIRSIDIRAPKLADHRRLYTQLDVRDRAALEKIVREFIPTHVFHLAARTDLDGSSLDDYSTNTVGTATLLDSLTAVQSRARVIIASTRFVFHPGLPTRDDEYRPYTTYGHSKASMEQLVRAHAYADWILVRPTSIWGPWFERPYRDFFDTVRARRYLHPRNLVVRKSMGFVGNAVFQLDRIVGLDFQEHSRRTFYISDYRGYDIAEWAADIAQLSGAPEPISVPLWVLRLGARVGDAVAASGLNPPLTTFRLANILSSQVFDTSATEHVVPGLPFDWREGDRITVQWIASRS